MFALTVVMYCLGHAINKCSQYIQHNSQYTAQFTIHAHDQETNHQINTLQQSLDGMKTEVK